MARSQLLLPPNIITLARLAAIPVVVWMLTTGDATLRIAALVLFAVAALSDGLDGYIARRYDMGSPFGRMLDPIADKLLVGVVLLALAWDGSLSALDLVPAGAILFREFFVSGLREYLGPANVVLPVTLLAKWKTALQLVALCLVFLEGVVAGLGLVSDVVLWAAGLVTAWTGLHYLVAAWPHLNEVPR